VYTNRLKKKDSSTGYVEPYSLEDKNAYLARFNKHPDMVEIIPTEEQRRAIALKVFRTRWLEACATVTRLDGTEFFID
jgi:hypothetical protein